MEHLEMDIPGAPDSSRVATLDPVMEETEASDAWSGSFCTQDAPNDQQSWTKTEPELTDFRGKTQWNTFRY